MRLVTAVCALCIPNYVCLAQKVLEGSVYDKDDDVPVVGAFVYAYDGTSMTGYAMSDANGSFAVKVPEGKSADRITVTCLGYKSETLGLEGRTPPFRIMLLQQALTIRESKVTASAIEEKGDTLVFAAAAFADGSEKVLGDLLEKIPGLSITPSGGIRYEGDHIVRFYVEGMDLMGNRYGVVTRNLSPDMVSRVEVLKHHQPLKILSGVSDTDKSAVNIILKESAKNTWMMTSDALCGAPRFPLFDARLLVTRFSGKSQDLYLAKGNNVGEDILRELLQQQYAGKAGVYLISGDNLDSDFSTRLDPSRTSLPLPKEYWYDNLSAIASVNHLRRIDDDRQMRASLQMAAERYDESSSSFEWISFGDGRSMSILEDRISDDEKYYASGRVTYENNSHKKYVMNELSFSGQFRSNSGTVSGPANDGAQRYRLPSCKISNYLDMTFRTASGRALTLGSLTEFVHSDHSGIYKTDAFDARQSFRREEFVSENGLTYALSAGGIKMNLGAQLNMDYLSLESELTGPDAIGSGTDAVLDIFSVSPGLRAEMKFFIGKTEARAALPLKLHAVSLKNASPDLFYPSLSPSLSLERAVTPELKAKASVYYDRSKSDVETLLPAAVMTDYRTVSYPDSLAERSGLFSSLSLKYADNISMFYATLAASFYLNRADRTSDSRYSDLVTVAGYRDAKQSSGSYGLNSSLSKFFGTRTFVVELNGGWQRSDNRLYLQSELRTYRTDIFKAALNLRMSPVDWLSMDSKTEWTGTKIRGASDSGSNTVTTSASLSLTPFRSYSFMASAHYRYEDTVDKSVSNPPLLKLSVSRQFRKLTVLAECRNVFDCREFTRKYVSEFRTVSVSSRLKGRQFIVGIRMSL